MKGWNNHMKKAYQTPDVDILYIDATDVIATSGMGEWEDDYVEDEFN